jgi:IS30 family transposase
MAKQGSALSEYEIRRIVTLLTSTEMTIHEIATRMGCSPSTVVNVNRNYQVRQYAGARTQWRVMQDALVGPRPSAMS